MAVDDSFEPRLGRMHARGGKRARTYLQRVLAATHLAHGGALSPSTHQRAFTGSRIGRGAGTGRVLAARDRFAAFRQRRVIVKARIVKLAGRGAAGAVAHLRYLQRDGVTRDGAAGTLYDAQRDVVPGKEFHARCTSDRHQFRLIVSAEDGADYEDLKPLTRRLITQMERDLGTSLDWVAVDHHNTGHPHTHIIVRGVDDRGADLVIARDYLAHGVRERAAELVDLDLGPRTTRDIEERLRAEIGQERFTSIDRSLLRGGDKDSMVEARGRDAFDHALRAGRLAKLARLGLADPAGAGHWRLAEDLEATLRQMGERGDIIRTMQREVTRRALERSPADQAIYDAAGGNGPTLIGRLVSRGLADEHADRHFLLVDALDGRSYFIDIGKPDNLEMVPEDAIVRIEALRPGIRDVDRTIAAVAAANNGRYDVDAHLRHDPAASQAFAETNVRRLEAMRRAGTAIEREPSGSWVLGPDHLEAVAVFEAARLRDRPVAITTLSHRPLAALVAADGATWLDRRLVAHTTGDLRDAGFGREVADAQARRRQWLVAQGFAEEAGGATTYRPGMLDALQRRELSRVAGTISDGLGLPYVEARAGARVSGVYRRSINLASGRFAVVERARDFTLVPWRPVLDRHVGKSVSGLMRGDSISWSIGRGRQGPTIS